MSSPLSPIRRSFPSPPLSLFLSDDASKALVLRLSLLDKRFFNEPIDNEVSPAIKMSLPFPPYMLSPPFPPTITSFPS